MLVVEDNPGDVRLIREAFAESHLDSSLAVATDGEAALDYLHGRDAERPDLVTLDLNVPRVDGNEVLEAVKTTPDLASIPVVVLSSSSSREDIEETRELAANSYFVKPVDPAAFISLVRRFVETFAAVGRLPLGEYETPVE